MRSAFFILLLHPYTLHNIQFWSLYKYLGYFRISQSQVVELSFKLSHLTQVWQFEDGSTFIRLRRPLSSSAAPHPLLLHFLSLSNTSSAVFWQPVLGQLQLRFNSLVCTLSAFRQLQQHFLRCILSTSAVYLLSFSCSLSASAEPPQPRQHFISFSRDFPLPKKWQLQSF